MNAPLALRLFRFVYVAYIVFASAKTFIGAHEMAAGVAATGAHHHAAHLVTPAFLQGLSGAEIAAALALLIARAELYAGCALLVVYAVAGGLDLALGEFPAHLFLYAATVGFFLAVRRTDRAPPQLKAA